MKATLNGNGQLNIKAENGIEEFALSKWFEDYTEKKGYCSLSIETHKHVEEH